METNVSNKAKWGMFGFAIPVMIWTLLPLVWIFALSLKSDAALTDTTGKENSFGNFFPTHPSWDNYELILKGERPTCSCRRCGTRSWCRCSPR